MAEAKWELLLDLGARLAREAPLDELLEAIGRRVAGALDADRATIWLIDAKTGELTTRVADLPELPSLALPVGRGLAGVVARDGGIINLADVTQDPRWAPEVDERTGYTTRSMLVAALVDEDGRVRGVVQVLNKRGRAFSVEDEGFLATLAGQVARALEYTSLAPGPSPRGVPLRGPWNHVVGTSAAMRAVYERLGRAAVTDATVLLHGETGTGKTLLARAIHASSARRDAPFVVVDVTTLPATLIESELFGHERGAYTGADARVRGKVELAAGGTLFLDEVGELPLELQGKLLRFVQERAFERVGGREVLTAEVRLVAATNRDLEALVAAGKFRADLYYRLRVIDIETPPLRARGSEDRLALAEHFLAASARRYASPARRFGDDAKAALVAYPFPGNVRELEHAVERAVVLGTKETIDAATLALGPPRRTAPVAVQADPGAVPAGLTLEEATRRYAKAALEAEGGNRSAAARALDISRNRLARLLDDEVDPDEA